MIAANTIEQNIHELAKSKQALLEGAVKTHGKFDKKEGKRLVYSLFDKAPQRRPWGQMQKK